MIPFFFREVVGWLLTLFGLANFAVSLYFLVEPRHKIIEGGLTAIIGIFLFHNGIKLQRMALAARVVDRERRQSP